MKKLALLSAITLLLVFFSPFTALAQTSEDWVAIEAHVNGDPCLIGVGDTMTIPISRNGGVTVALQIIDQDGVIYGDMGAIAATDTGMACACGGHKPEASCEGDGLKRTIVYRVGANHWRDWYVTAEVKGSNLEVHVLNGKEVDDLLIGQGE